jgi:oxalate decarboxylase/phosphoglucose isomerase-like protein (cupin superfamily)
MLHSLENIGDTPLMFTTVEFLDGTNAALPLPDSVRLTPPQSAAA